MKFSQYTYLALLYFIISNSLYAVSITQEDGKYGHRIIVDFSGKEAGKPDDFDGNLYKKISKVRNSGHTNITIKFLNISRDLQLESIKAIVDELIYKLEFRGGGRIYIGEFNYKDEVGKSLRRKGDKIKDDYESACEKIENRQHEERMKTYERAARAKQRRADFDESQGLGSSGWMGNDYFDSSDDD